MSKNNRRNSHGVQRSDIPYKDRLMVNRYANIAQHRDHSAVVANKIGMVALNDLKGMGYIQLTRWGLLYNSLNEEFYSDPEYQEAKLDERIRKMGFVVENGKVIVAEDENGEIVPTSTLVLCPEILFVREQLSPADQFGQVAEEAVELAHAAMKMQRILNGTNPTPVTEKEAMGKVMEEICDLYNALEVLKLDVSLKYEGIRKKKMARWVERIQKGVKALAR
jgi:hypothetical protein